MVIGLNASLSADDVVNQEADLRQNRGGLVAPVGSPRVHDDLTIR